MSAGQSACVSETTEELKATFLAETDDDRRWELLVKLHDLGWAYRPFNQGGAVCSSPRLLAPHAGR